MDARDANDANDARQAKLLEQEALAARILEGLARRGARGEVYVARTDSLSAMISAGHLRTSLAEARTSVAVRALAGGKLGFYSTTDLSAPEDAVRRVLSMAETGDDELELPGPDGAPTPPGAPLTHDPRVAAMGSAGVVALVREVAGRVEAAATKDVQVQAGVRASVTSRLLLNSSGGRQGWSSTQLGLDVQASRFAASDVLLVFNDASSARFEQGDVDALVARVGGLLADAGSQASLGAGKRRVVFAPEAAFLLLQPFLVGVDGANVRRKVSPLAGKLGQQVADQRLTVTDDPWLDWSPVSGRRDDEGTPARPKAILDRGVLTAFLYDLKQAAEAGTASTGNGRRGAPGNPPAVGTFNVRVAPGQTPLHELLAEAGEGLYVVNVIGGSVGGELTGAFSNPVALGYLIKEGRLAGRVKDVAVAGNTYDLLRSAIVALEDRVHRQGEGEQLIVPHILVDGVDVAAAK